MRASVILCTHNPQGKNLARTLAGLQAQTLPAGEWETLVIDNLSSPRLEASALSAVGPANLRVLAEPRLGLTHARRRGLEAAQGATVVFVDDDNVVARDYLIDAIRILERNPKLGAIGGPSRPEFERAPDAWQNEFLGLLALRDLGTGPMTSAGLRPPGSARNEYPACAPIGAGLVLRAEAARTWLNDGEASRVSDRRGTDLGSGGDNDIVFTVMRHGWEVGYFPELSLTHLIPAGRLQADYLARINRGIQRTWMQVLSRHDANPWPPIPAWTLPLRKGKAWLTYRAWTNPSARIRWQGACGHFEGRVLRPATL